MENIFQFVQACKLGIKLNLTNSYCIYLCWPSIWRYDTAYSESKTSELGSLAQISKPALLWDLEQVTQPLCASVSHP